MALVAIKLKEPVTVSDNGHVKSGEKEDVLKVSAGTAHWEVEAGRAEYVKEEAKKKE